MNANSRVFVCHDGGHATPGDGFVPGAVHQAQPVGGGGRHNAAHVSEMPCRLVGKLGETCVLACAASSHSIAQVH